MFARACVYAKRFTSFKLFRIEADKSFWEQESLRIEKANANLLAKKEKLSQAKEEFDIKKKHSEENEKQLG